MIRRAGAGLFLILVAAARLAHKDVIWIEEAYPAAGALQILEGKVPYRDFFFDKPPLAALTPILWLGYDGWPMRLAGAAFAILVCWLAWRIADDMWGPREGLLAGGLTGFFLTFGTPSAVIPLAPDLLMLAPHLAAVYLAWDGHPFRAGLMAGVALLVSTKGILVLAVVLLWQWRSAVLVLAGFGVPAIASAAALASLGALGEYCRQVWWWGSRYAADSHLANALGAGVERTINWAAFHATLVLGAAWFWLRAYSDDGRRLARWAILMFASVALGLRWFPRYYFAILPPLTLAASRGLALMDTRRAALVLALLAVPLVRYGPRYFRVGDPAWGDTAMYRDSARAAGILRAQAQAGDTLLVWGYRPDIFQMTRLPAGTPFLDSQPLTGVIADRHLTESRPTFPELAAANRRRLSRMTPTWVVDGLGPYNARLAITAEQDLRNWIQGYSEFARTPFCVIYRRR